jgi:dual-specificity kinase
MGEGTFARVIEAWDRVHKSPVAVKIVRAVDKYTDAAEVEIDILRDIHKKDPRHESRCIEMVNYFMFRDHMCLVFPKYGLSLYDFLKKNNYKGFMMNDIKDIGYQLLKCISCNVEKLFNISTVLHSINLIHTDLKPENILFKSSGYFIYSVFLMWIHGLG